MDRLDNNTVSRIPGWLTESEMRNITGFKTTKLWKLRQIGVLQSSKIGNKVFYKLESLIRYLDNQIPIK
jgi:hypothetical protein